jgi:hypothetical protein
VILVGDRRPEQGHHPIACELVDRALHAMHRFRNRRKEAIEQTTPTLGVERLGEIHRAHDVHEHHRDLLALALDPLVCGMERHGELFRWAARRLLPRRLCFADRLTTAIAEACSGAQLGAAGGAGTGERRTAGLTETCPCSILMVAARAIHSSTALRAWAAVPAPRSPCSHSGRTILRPVSLSISRRRNAPVSGSTRVRARVRPTRQSPRRHRDGCCVPIAEEIALRRVAHTTPCGSCLHRSALAKGGGPAQSRSSPASRACAL